MTIGYTMTITPDELKQIVREAVLETMTVKSENMPTVGQKVKLKN